MKTLLCFGDSWPQGGELTDLSCRYGDQLVKDLGFDQYFNYGKGGSSNEDLVTQLHQHFEQHDTQENHITVAVFHLTNPARSAYWSDIIDPVWVETESWPKDLQQRFYKMWLHFQTYEHFRSSLTVTYLQQYCKLRGIHDFYFSGWVRYRHWFDTIDQSKIWQGGEETAADWFGCSDHNGEHIVNAANNAYIRPNFCHPNSLGHRLIADKLNIWITSKVNGL